MKTYRLLQRLFAGFFGLVLLIGTSSQFLNSRHELFPFFSWFLFSLVPRPDAIVYELLIHEAPAGQIFDPPLSYRRASEGLLRSPHSVDLYRTVQELGRAAQMRDTVACDRLRAALERRFRVTGPVRYEIVKQTYDNPIARWSSPDSPHRQESVAVFLSGAPSTSRASAGGAPPTP